MKKETVKKEKKPEENSNDCVSLSGHSKQLPGHIRSVLWPYQLPARQCPCVETGSRIHTSI